MIFMESAMNKAPTSAAEFDGPEVSKPIDLRHAAQADLFDHLTALGPTTDEAHGGNRISSRSHPRPSVPGQIRAFMNEHRELEKKADDAKFLLVARDRELERKKYQLEMMKSFFDEKKGELLAFRQVIFESSGLEVTFDLDYPSWLKELLEDDAAASRARRSQP